MTKTRDLQKQVMDTRKQLDMRKLYDAEIERWYDTLRSNFDVVEKEVTVSLGKLDMETEKHRMLLAKVQGVKSGSDSSQKDETKSPWTPLLVLCCLLFLVWTMAYVSFLLIDPQFTWYSYKTLLQQRLVELDSWLSPNMVHDSPPI